MIYNICTLKQRAGELLLLDAGGEWNGYASDITRTVPISGRFTETQRRLYDTLQLLQRQLIAECRSDNGMTLGQLFQQSVQLIADRICRGLFGVSAGGGDLMALVRRIYPHHIGHWLGMDVHDCSQASQGYLYGIDDGDNQKESSPSSVFWWKHDQFRDGMVVTVEPGIYIPPADYSRNLDDEILQLIPQEYRGIGIRIEDDIVINGRLPENLTRWLPTESTLLEEIINS
jgi:intermediate cleaving peptidase 55